VWCRPGAARFSRTGRAVNGQGDGVPGPSWTVLRSLQFEVLGLCRWVPVLLIWSKHDPYEVGLVFPGTDRSGGVRWRMARELLADGLAGPAGMGDVAVLPDLVYQGCVELVLSSPDGVIALRVPTRALRSFLRATWRQVPAGAEVQPADSFAPDDFPDWG
jgi:hypothetical protein